MKSSVFTSVEDLIRGAPAAWLTSACEVLASLPATTALQQAIQRLPPTNNADLAFLTEELLHEASGVMSWEALSWVLQSTRAAHQRWNAERQIELLWSGPSPANKIPARRIDQTLYDLISNAKHEILLVTFAAARIDRLAQGLSAAVSRGVKVRLVLEFKGASEGQLTFDALKAFPATLSSAAEIFYWPVGKRDRNRAGRPGKLHAKLAIIDDVALVSSANLTDDAFNRNLEIGALIKDPVFLSTIVNYIDALISNEVLSSASGVTPVSLPLSIHSRPFE